MMTGKSIRVRFAPSPTGDPHFGTVRTALFNYLFAKHTGGTFVLRIEDTDKAREVTGSEEKIVEVLEWLGLPPDEGATHGGPYAPYRQSERTAQYAKHAERLVQSGHAYRCFCTPDRLASLRAEQEKNHQPPRYDRHCRNVGEAEAQKRREAGEACVIRLKVPDNQTISWVDEIKGEISFQSNEIDDQVLLKSDDYPTYHLANVVDDHAMQISHVIRGEDWLSSTPKHLLLYGAFGWDMPVFAHLPLIFGPDKTKLSKRHGDTSMLVYKREKGYHPMAVVHFMAFLGWTPEEVKETYTLPELANEFTLKRVGSSPAIFDQAKLDSLGLLYLQHDSLDHVYRLFTTWAEQAEDPSAKQFLAVARSEEVFACAAIDVARRRCSSCAEISQFVASYLTEDQFQHLSAADLTLEGKIPTDQARQAIQIVLQGVQALSEDLLPADDAEKNITGIHDHFRALQPSDLSGQAYLHPTRVAITGMRQSMNMSEYLVAYLKKSDGRQVIIDRLGQAIRVLSK